MTPTARRGFSHLKTPRLSLVPPGEVDPDAIVAAIDDFEIARWLTRVPHPYARADAVAFHDYCAGNEGRVWLARDAAGLAGAVSADPELGYWVARRAWGRGYATEMSCAVIDAWFSDPAAAALSSGHFEGNFRSRRVLDRLGFRPAGTGERHPLSLGRAVLLHRMVLDRDGWREARLRIAPN